MREGCRTLPSKLFLIPHKINWPFTAPALVTRINEFLDTQSYERSVILLWELEKEETFLKERRGRTAYVQLTLGEST